MSGAFTAMYRAAYYGLSRNKRPDEAAAAVKGGGSSGFSSSGRNAVSLGDEVSDEEEEMPSSDKLVLVGSAAVINRAANEGDSTPEEVESVIEEPSFVRRRNGNTADSA